MMSWKRLVSEQEGGLHDGWKNKGLSDSLLSLVELEGSNSVARLHNRKRPKANLT